MTVVLDRRQRLFDAMDAAGIEALVLGRPGDVAYASGATALWTSGSRPFAPSCVVVDREIHLLSTWDEGVPEDIPSENLFGLSWNPQIAAGHIRSVPGLAHSHRIGTDGTSVSFQRLIASAAPDAEVVDARGVIDEARSVKTSEEIHAIEHACRIAEAGLDAMTGAASPGTTERELLGRLTERVGADATVVPDEAVAHATTAGFRTVVSDRSLQAGELVALSPSSRLGGYHGTIARTIVVGADATEAQGELGRRCGAALDAVLTTCRPGATGHDLLAAWHDAGGRELPVLLAHGLGLGTEPPLIGLGLGDGALLAAGMVLAVQGWLHEPGVGGWLERDVVHVTAHGPRRLTRGSSR